MNKQLWNHEKIQERLKGIHKPKKPNYTVSSYVLIILMLKGKIYGEQKKTGVAWEEGLHVWIMSVLV